MRWRAKARDAEMPRRAELLAGAVHDPFRVALIGARMPVMHGIAALCCPAGETEEAAL